MEFYYLIDEETNELIADIVKFENEHFVGYFHKFKILQEFIDIFDFYDYMKNSKDLDGLKWKLIYEEIIEQ